MTLLTIAAISGDLKVGDTVTMDDSFGARKDDKGKSPIFQGALAYFPRAISAVADVSAFGATKYAWGGWVHVEGGLSRYTDAMVRHLAAEGSGEKYDPESKLKHAAHVAWGALARLELMLKQEETNEVD